MDVVIDRAARVGENVSGKLPVLVAQHRRTCAQSQIRYLSEGDLRSVHRGDSHAPERLQVGTEVAGVSNRHRIAFASLDGGRHRQASDGSLDGILDVADVEAEPGGAVAIDIEVEEIPAADPFRERAARSRNFAQRRLDLRADPIDHLGVGAEHQHAERAPHAGRQHFGARLDRHPPDVGHARKLQRGIQLAHQRVQVFHARLQVHDGLEHREWGWVGRRVETSRFAEYALDLGESLDHLILPLKDVSRGGVAHTGNAGRHVEQGALVERRHEFAAEELHYRHRESHEHERAEDHRPAEAQGEAADRIVEPAQHAADRIVVLVADLPADEGGRDGGDQRDREQRRERHREGLGPGERREEAAFSTLQREYG